jgi:hypothetical protein
VVVLCSLVNIQNLGYFTFHFKITLKKQSSLRQQDANARAAAWSSTDCQQLFPKWLVTLFSGYIIGQVWMSLFRGGTATLLTDRTGLKPPTPKPHHWTRSSFTEIQFTSWSQNLCDTVNTIFLRYRPLKWLLCNKVLHQHFARISCFTHHSSISSYYLI